MVELKCAGHLHCWRGHLPLHKPAHRIPGSTGAVLLLAVGLVGLSLGKEGPHCPIEMAEFPKVGQVNFLRRADLLVTMDIAQLYTNNPP